MLVPTCFASRARREFSDCQPQGRSAPEMLLSSCALLLSFALGTSAFANVYDVTISDVTPRAFSVIWMSDTPIAAATVQVFAGSPDNLVEITDDLNVQTISASYTSAHDRGIVKVDVTSDMISLEPDTVYYLRTRTESRDTPALIVEYPLPTEPLLEVQTAVAVTVSQSADPSLPIANDLYFHTLYDPDGAESPDGALMLIRVPDLSPYPISAFVGEGASAPLAISDLNNVFGNNTFAKN
jgi:hypothetical protein